MRTRRTIFSMVVFLSVFWLSLILNIEKPSSTQQESLLTDEASMSVANNDADEHAAPRVMSYSYDSSLTASQNNRLYGARYTLEDIEESNQQEEEESSAPSAEAAEPADGVATMQASVNSISADISLTGEEPDSGTESSGQEADEISASDSDGSSTPAEPTPLPEEIKEEPSEYANIGISIANNYVNIREKADTESQVLGKLYKDSAAEILGTEGEWYLVESGSVKGYVKAEYIQTGIPEEELIKKYGTLRIRVNVDGLNVREEPTTESDKLTTIYMNERYPVMELQDEWVKVDISDDRVIGYVRRDLVELIVDFKKAVSKEEEAELIRLQAEERAKQETAIKYREEVDYTKEDLKLLACLVHAEAGDQCYEGKLAVANIVLNRIKSSKYPNTLKDVIYQPGQFTVAKSGSLAKQLANYGNYTSKSQKLSIKAAKAALEGANNIGSRLYFHTYKAAKRKGYVNKPNAVKIEDHLFW